MQVSISLLVLVCLSLLLCVSSQSGSGGGTCYESRGRTEACPTYNFTRYGPPDDGYELRTYDPNTWSVESSNLTVIPSDFPRPIEGIFATYRPLEDYFFGDNDKHQNISRDTAPGVIGIVPVAAGQWGYVGGIILPPLSSYPPPNPLNSTVSVYGGMSFSAYVKRFSPERSPTNEEIIASAERFARQLTNDSVKFQNVTVAAFYEFIGAPGNWSKEIWFLPPDSTFLNKVVAPLRSTPSTTRKARRSHLNF